ncbi:hypothetical protein LTR08_001517 [Meristemomyces frigidus]|nr:hypothetical protein LTR08_001517 [Meristemomyces frigidus]
MPLQRIDVPWPNDIRSYPGTSAAYQEQPTTPFNGTYPYRDDEPAQHSPIPPYNPTLPKLRVPDIPTMRATPAAKPEVDHIELFKRYNDAWGELEPHAIGIPSPSLDLTEASLKIRDNTIKHSSNIAAWSEETVIKANAFRFFARGFGQEMIVSEQSSSKVELRLKLHRHPKPALQALLRHLRLKESVRWHPDKVNARTGEVGRLDERNGRSGVVVAVRSAVQELVGEVEKALEYYADR